MASKIGTRRFTFWKDAIDELLVNVFLESQDKAPEQIILDIDTTDLPLHGQQEGRFFHGYYDQYCYLPLYIFCGEHLLCARLRSNPTAMLPPGAGRRSTHRSSNSQRHGRQSTSSCVPTPGSAGTS